MRILGLGVVLLVLGLPSAAGAAITEYPIPTHDTTPIGITAGPDGALWFTENGGLVASGADKIGRITTGGSTSEFLVDAEGDSNPVGIVSGPDGALWFTQAGFFRGAGQIGRLTTTGALTEFAGGTGPGGIDVGPDDALWFTEEDAIGRITTAGASSTFPIGSGIGTALPVDIAAGPDGALWFTEFAGDKVGRISTAGTIREFPTPTPDSAPWGISAGPDGAMWFTERDAVRIGRIDVRPTTTNDCRNGGWRNFPGFKNQGDCVSFVVRQAVKACVFEREAIGHRAFREKYGAGRFELFAMLRCIHRRVGG
jgi:streptogramin lyase